MALLKGLLIAAFMLLCFIVATAGGQADIFTVLAWFGLLSLPLARIGRESQRKG